MRILRGTAARFDKSQAHWIQATEKLHLPRRRARLAARPGVTGTSRTLIRGMRSGKLSNEYHLSSTQGLASLAGMWYGLGLRSHG
jgi:hypothetical protein